MRLHMVGSPTTSIHIDARTGELRCATASDSPSAQAKATAGALALVMSLDGAPFWARDDGVVCAPAHNNATAGTDSLARVLQPCAPRAHSTAHCLRLSAGAVVPADRQCAEASPPNSTAVHILQEPSLSPMLAPSGSQSMLSTSAPWLALSMPHTLLRPSLWPSAAPTGTPSLLARFGFTSLPSSLVAPTASAAVAPAKNTDLSSTACTDRLGSSRCAEYRANGFCDDSTWKNLLQEQCAKSCNSCVAVASPAPYTSVAPEPIRPVFVVTLTTTVAVVLFAVLPDPPGRPAGCKWLPA